MKKISTRFIVSMVGVALLVVLIMGGVSYINVRSMLLKTSEENLTSIVRENAAEIEMSITEMKTISKQLENVVVKSINVSELKRNPEAMGDFKERILPTFLGVLESFDAQSGWFVFDDATIPNAGILSFTKKESGYNREADYNVRADGYDQDAWFQGAIDNGVNWSDPYFWEAWNADIISYSQGVKVGNDVLGVVGTDFFYNNLKEKLAQISVYETGYVTLISKDFNILYHPSLEGENLKTVSEGALATVAEQMETGDDVGIIPYRFDGDSKLMAYARLSNGWYITANPVIKEIYKDLNRLTMIFLGIGVLGVFISILIAVTVGKRLSKSVSDFKNAFEIGASGDLSVRVDIKTKDEFALMGEELNSFMSRIHQVIDDIRTVVLSATDQNNQIVKSMDNIIKGSNSEHYRELDFAIDAGMNKMSDNLMNALDNVKNQAAGTQQSLAGLEEILASTREAFENTEQALKSSVETSKIAKDSESDVKDMSENMALIDKNVQEANVQIDKLTHLSSDIGGILLTINEISEKTNLLALNAAIEAARAGEAGRGFAVVADEIRKLAEQTSSETDKITEIVESIQKEVAVVQGANKLVTSNVVTGLDTSLKVKKRIGEILAQAEKTFEVIKALEISSKEQMVATEEITKAVGDIAENSVDIESSVFETHESFDRILQALNASQESIDALNEQMHHIEEEVKFFKL